MYIMQARRGGVIRGRSGRLLLFFVLMLGGVGLDQLTKSVVFSRFGGEEASKEVTK